MADLQLPCWCPTPVGQHPWLERVAAPWCPKHGERPWWKVIPQRD